MAPSEWIARSTIWGSLGPAPIIDESTRIHPGAGDRSSGSEVAHRDGGDTVSHLFGTQEISSEPK